MNRLRAWFCVYLITLPCTVTVNLEPVKFGPGKFNPDLVIPPKKEDS
jgi:hypothetical protein